MRLKVVAGVLALLASAGLWAPARAQIAQRKQLRDAILQALIADPELGQYPLAASVDADHNVVLNGVLPNKRDQKLAERLVKSLSGVASVRDAIAVDPKVTPLPSTAAAVPAGAAEPTGLELQRQIQQALDANPALRGVTAKVYAGALALTGTVARQADKVLAGRLAIRYAGPLRVDNQVQVTGAAAAE